MGIVVAIALLFGVLALFSVQRLARQKWLVILLALTGAWNVHWYGLQHIGEFWGWIALASGATMMMSSIVLHKGSQAYSSLVLWLLRFAMLGFLLLYVVTIIQLNLGYPILR